MSVYRDLVKTITLAMLFGSVSAAALQAPAGPPPTRTDNVKDVLHGVEVVDPYRWLEDQNSPETRAWIDAQNKYSDAVVGDPPVRQAIVHRLGELLKVDSFFLPTERGGKYFYMHRRADQDLSVLYMRNGLNGAEEVLVDPHPMSADHSTSVSLYDASDDGVLIAFAIRRGGADETEIRFLDTNTRKEMADVLPAARIFSVTITPDRKQVFYTQQSKDGPRIYLHVFGSANSTDQELFGKGYGPEKIIYHGISDDGRYLIAVVLYGSAGDKTELYLAETAHPADWKTVVNDIPARFYPEFAGNTLLLRTNWKAPKGRVLAAPLTDPIQPKWHEVIPEGQGNIESVSAVGGHILVRSTEAASSRVKLYTMAGKLVRQLPLTTIGTVDSLSGRWARNEAFYTFASFLVPTQILRYDLKTGKQEVWAKLAVKVESDKYEVKQVWFESKDKTRVPMFLVAAKGLKLDGSHPVLMTGYGGFTVSETPVFSSLFTVWVEHGGVFALVNLRGGGEFGEEWHKAGMMEKKQNVFDDFYAAAEWLIQNKYTVPAKLAIRGGSNGGLLVGAALTQRPELFGAIVCNYPLLDMLRFQKFLVGSYWVPEYGSADDPQQFKYILAYSPYQNVKKGTKYPATLFQTGDSDTRVAPLHARKMAALVQASTGSDKPVLLHYDTKSGHSGGKPISKIIEDNSFELTFLFNQLKMD